MLSPTVIKKLTASPYCKLQSSTSGLHITIRNPTDTRCTATMYLDYSLGERPEIGDTYYNRLVSWLSPACKACKVGYILNSPKIRVEDIG